MRGRWKELKIQIISEFRYEISFDFSLTVAYNKGHGKRAGHTPKRCP